MTGAKDIYDEVAELVARRREHPELSDQIAELIELHIRRHELADWIAVEEAELIMLKHQLALEIQDEDSI